MKIFAILTFLVLSIGIYGQDIQHHPDLEYGEFKKYFALGEVDFYRATGYLDGRESDYEVYVNNKYPFEVCLVPTLKLIKNGRIEFFEPSYIIPANSEVNLGNYGAKEFGKSWHVKWDYFISRNLEYCAI